MSKLVQFWSQAGKDLGFEVVSPFQLVLSSGHPLNIPILVKGFGAKNGMLVTTTFRSIEDYTDQIAEMGYGFSTMSEYAAGQAYNAEDFIDVLKDWGWSGSSETEPGWLKDSLKSYPIE